MKRSFVTIADFGPLMMRSTCITLKSARFRHRERRLALASAKFIRRGISIKASGFTPIARVRTPKAEQNPNRGYWSRISKIARARIRDLGRNAKSSNEYRAQPRRTQGMNGGDSLIDKRGRFKTASAVTGPIRVKHQLANEHGSRFPEITYIEP
jgi:hypothetical protein